ncbi:MAG: CoA transferase [Candidatus Parvarchaeota archaeon]
MSRLPLEGVRVLDASRVLAGPFCTMLLSDLGAEIIKVEDPARGDETRNYQPMIGNESSYFLSINRNKESIFLDLNSDAGRKRLYSLVKKSDVFLHNFLPRVEKKLGVTYEKIRSQNNGILYVTISAYGGNSTRADLPGYDILMQGESGLMSVTGCDENTLARIGNSTVDIYTGYLAATVILAYLLANSRRKQRKSVKLNIPLFGSAVYSMPFLFSSFAATGRDPIPLGTAHPGIVPYQSFATSDGRIIIAVANNNHWEKFCRVTNMEELLQDERFSSNELRVKNRDILIPIIGETIKTKKTAEWLSIFRQNSVPAAPINKISDVLKDKELKEYIDTRKVRGKEMYFPKFPLLANNKPVYAYKKDPPKFEP